MSERNYYELLGVSPGAAISEITVAFNRRLREINENGAPDRLDDLKVLIEAFAILSNEEKRADYDQFLRVGQAIVPDDQGTLYQSTSLVERIKFENIGENVEQVLPPMIEKMNSLFSKIKDNRVRLKYRGKQIGPDIPMAYAVALEAMGLLGAGVVRTVVTNLGIKTLFDIEFVSVSEQVVARGDQQYHAGDLDDAEKTYRQALELYPKSSLACLRLAVLSKVRGNREETRLWLEKATKLDPVSEAAVEAAEILSRL